MPVGAVVVLERKANAARRVRSQPEGHRANYLGLVRRRKDVSRAGEDLKDQLAAIAVPRIVFALELDLGRRENGARLRRKLKGALKASQAAVKSNRLRQASNFCARRAVPKVKLDVLPRISQHRLRLARGIEGVCPAVKGGAGRGDADFARMRDRGNGLAFDGDQVLDGNDTVSVDPIPEANRKAFPDFHTPADLHLYARQEERKAAGGERSPIERREGVDQHGQNHFAAIAVGRVVVALEVDEIGVHNLGDAVWRQAECAVQAMETAVVAESHG